MAVTQGYLNKLLRAVRIRNANVDIQIEVTNLCEEARADLERLGVLPNKTIDEADPLILSAVRSYVRGKWQLTKRKLSTTEKTICFNAMNLGGQ